MALMRANEVPEDAVSLTDIEAVQYAWDVVDLWDCFSDTYVLIHGIIICSKHNL